MVKSRVNPLMWLRKGIDEADADLLREMVKSFAEMLMWAEADNRCGAPYGERSVGRVNHRNGYRERQWDTRVGSIELSIPRLRKGSYFPEWLLCARKRAERALMQVVVEAYVKGVSTRQVDGLVQAMGVEGMSKSQVSELAQELDGMVEEFRKRRDIIVRELCSIPGMDCTRPEGAFYVFPGFNFPISSEEMAMELIKGGVVSTPGRAFGPLGEGHIRFSYANSLENIKMGMDRTRTVCERLMDTVGEREDA